MHLQIDFLIVKSQKYIAQIFEEYISEFGKYVSLACFSI